MVPTDEAASLLIRLFGPFETRLNDQPLARLRYRKSQSVLALLALRRGSPVERRWLTGLLWPDSIDGQMLRNCLSDLRRALGPQACRLHCPTPQTLALDLSRAVVDVIAFDEAIARGDPTSLEEAAALRRGPLLEGSSEEWAFQERQLREQTFLASLEKLSVLALERGELATAERHLRLAAATDPLRESAQRALMQLLGTGGNYAAALLVFRELRLRLHRELNAEPDPETRALFQRLRTDARRPVELPPGSGARFSSTMAAAIAGSTAQVIRTDPPSPPSREAIPCHLPLSPNRGPMVGRDAEFTELKRQIDAALAGAGATLFLAGEAGIGKTRLAMEASDYARPQGFRVLVGRCDEQGAAPYQPLVEALRGYLDATETWQVEQAMPPPVACELVRIVPQIAGKVKEIPKVPPLPAEPARQALTDAVRQFFAFVTTHDAPILLFLDDLHWADEGSLALLHALARQARSLRLLILGTYRDVEVDAQHPLERTLAVLNRERLSQRLLLRRLSEPAVAEMVGALLDELLPAPFLALLHRQTEGNPFFIEEMLQHLVEEGAISREGGRWQIQLPDQLSIPQSIKMTIGRRLERLGEESREALTLAAVIGQQFSFDLLLQASELEEERLLAITEEWQAAHLVVEQRVGRAEVYRFQHALLRTVPYEAMSLRRRARLHERVGLALEAVHAGDVEQRLEELAHHFAQARSGTAVEKGVDYCLRAGEKSRHFYGNEESIRHLTAALKLLDGLPEDEPHLRQRWEVVFSLEQAYLACRAFEQAEDALRDYMALAQQRSYAWGMAAAHYWMARTLVQSHAAAGVAHSESSRRLRGEWFEKSLQIAEQHGLTDWRARARVGLAYLLAPLFGDDLPRAEALLRKTLQAPEGLAPEDDPYGKLMLVCAWQGKWDEVATAFRQSIPFGGPRDLYICLGTMEEALNRAGKQSEFIAFCEEAKALYAQAGLPFSLNQWYLQPAAPSEELSQLLFRDDFDGPELRAEWQWHDPVLASTYSLSERPGHLSLRAGPGVDLHPTSKLNAPRILLEVRGDFALETKMAGDWDERDEDGASGLLVWKDVLNYVRLDKFARSRLHQGNVRLEARIAGAYEIIGRGLLRGDAFHLRLERTGDRFAALCSTDGVRWLACGQVVFPVKDPLLVGVAALHGMVVHFDYVRVLGRGNFPPR